MCDWDATEYQEYLLWVEAEASRGRVRARRVSEAATDLVVGPEARPTVSIEA